MGEKKKKITWKDIMLSEPSGKAREFGDVKPQRMGVHKQGGNVLTYKPRGRDDHTPWLDTHSGARYTHDDVDEKR